MKRNSNILEPWKEEIYGYENHYHSHDKHAKYAPLELIISKIKNFEKGNGSKRQTLIKYESKENLGGSAYDLGFPIYRGLADLNNSHIEILAAMIGKYPINIREMPAGNLSNSVIPEEYKIDFRSMDIKSDLEKMKYIKVHEIPEELHGYKKTPTPYEISELLMEGENRRIKSDELIALYFN